MCCVSPHSLETVKRWAGVPHSVSSFAQALFRGIAWETQEARTVTGLLFDGTCYFHASFNTWTVTSSCPDGSLFVLFECCLNTVVQAGIVLCAWWDLLNGSTAARDFWEERVGRGQIHSTCLLLQVLPMPVPSALFCSPVLRWSLTRAILFKCYDNESFPEFCLNPEQFQIFSFSLDFVWVKEILDMFGFKAV